MRSHPLPGLVLSLFLPLGTAACAGENGGGEGGAPLASHGRVVVIGGGLSSTNDAVYRTVLDGREGEGPLCIVPTASANPESSMANAATRFDAWGGEGTAVGILLSVDAPERALDQGVAEKLRRCSGFFFTGGVQSRILDFFLPEGRETPAFNAVMSRFREGAVVSGSSAGAAMMSHPMIAGGSSAAAFRAGLDGVRLTRGMGFVEGAAVDQHFLARGRIGRLFVAVLLHPEIQVGWGVDEDTALVLENGQAWVVGASGVVLVDGRSARSLAGEGGAARGDGLRLELLGAGDRVDLSTLRTTPAEGKAPVRFPGGAEAWEGELEGDLFERWVFLHRLWAWGSSEDTLIEEEVGGHRISFRKPPSGFRAVASPRDGVQGTPHGLSVGPLDVRIR